MTDDNNKKDRPCYLPWSTIRRGRKTGQDSSTAVGQPLLDLFRMHVVMQEMGRYAAGADRIKVQLIGLFAAIAGWICSRWPRLTPRNCAFVEADGRRFLVRRGRDLHRAPLPDRHCFFTADRVVLPRNAAAALRLRYEFRVIRAFEDGGGEADIRQIMADYEAEYERLLQELPPQFDG